MSADSARQWRSGTAIVSGEEYTLFRGGGRTEETRNNKISYRSTHKNCVRANSFMRTRRVVYRRYAVRIILYMCVSIIVAAHNNIRENSSWALGRED